MHSLGFFFFEKRSVNICGKKWGISPPFPLLDLVDRDRGRRARRPGNPLDSLAAQLPMNRQDSLREEDLSGLERHPSWAAHPGDPRARLGFLFPQGSQLDPVGLEKKLGSPPGQKLLPATSYSRWGVCLGY